MTIPETPLPSGALFDKLHEQGGIESIAQIWKLARDGPAPGGQYRHWQSVRYQPVSGGLTPEHVWLGLKVARQPFYRPLPLVDRDGKPFQYALVDPVLIRLHHIDRDAAGQLTLPEEVTNPQTRDRYVVRSLIEEAITSSQLEGAATTRAVAKEMIQSKRAPRDRSERMILNNYRAMQQVRERTTEPLTPAFLFDLHRTVTAGTLDAGTPTLRTPGDGVAVYDDQDRVLHQPPPAGEIGERMERLCAFANEAETGVFLHPVLKSILLHFWLAYDHPFTDGNGRTARALFYWSMLREGFWLAEYLSISSILKKAPARYGKSFLYTETDENDLTYFALAQLRVVEQAIVQLKAFLGHKVRETAETRALLHPSSGINHRQATLLGHAIRHPGAVYTVASHQDSHAVAYATSRSDLLALATAGLLEQTTRGRKMIFTAPPDVADRLRAVGR